MGVTAVLLLGVSRTGNYRELQAVTKAVNSMRDWARTQTEKQYIKQLTDTNGKRVTVSRVRKRVKKLLGLPEVERLVIYFSGHGAVNGYNEFWLMSDTPDFNEAVGIDATALSGRTLAVGHVILISDACRTYVPAGVATRIHGVTVIPDGGVDYRSKVDIFYAAQIGSPAYEVKAPDGSGYGAVYTETLAAALNGVLTEFVDTVDGNPRVRPATLEARLPHEVSLALERLEVPITIDQQPFAFVTSTADAWVSAPPIWPPLASATESAGEAPDAEAQSGAAIGETGEISARERAQKDVTDAISRAQSAGPSSPRDPVAAESSTLALASDLIQPPTGWRSRYPLSHWAGFNDRVIGQLQGSTRGSAPPPEDLIAAVTAALAGARMTLIQFVGLGPRRVRRAGEAGVSPGAMISRTAAGERVASVILPASTVVLGSTALIQLDDGGVILVPVAAGATIRIDSARGEVVSIAYSLPRSTPADRTRHDILRSAIGHASRTGAFSPDDELLDALLELGARDGDIDPMLSIHLSYALVERGRRTDLLVLRDKVADAAGCRFFDLEMLARTPAEGRGGSSILVPPYPMLTRGWALLSATPQGFDRLRQQLHPLRRVGVWTSFEAEAWELLGREIPL